MTDLHPSIADIDMPETIAHLPRDQRGYPVPWFVAYIDGEPDFRIVKPSGVDIARHHGLCWICGYPLGQTATYVAGPMCAINRTSAEPPSHHACADYAAKACPFLTRPHARRRENAKPEGTTVPGTMIRRNPGVAMLWRTTSITHPHLMPGDQDVLFALPDPIRVDWIAEGRDATHHEVRASVQTGIPLLRDAAAAEGPRAIEMLRQAIVAFYPLMPPAEVPA